MELVAKQSPNPIIPSEAKVEVIGVESKTLMIKWPVIYKAKSYEGYIINHEGEVEVSDTTNNLSYEFTISELKVNTIYEFKVTAKYSDESESKPKSIKVRTKK